MLGKEVKIFLKDGTIEPVICFDFRIGMDLGVAVIMCQVSPTRMYVVPLSKIHHFDVNYVWIFDGWEPPTMPPPPEHAL